MNLANSGGVGMNGGSSAGSSVGLYKFQPISSNPPTISSVGSINSSSTVDGIMPPIPLPSQYFGGHSSNGGGGGGGALVATGGGHNLNHVATVSSDQRKANGRLKTASSLSSTASSSFSPRGVSPNHNQRSGGLQSAHLMTSTIERAPERDSRTHRNNDHDNNVMGTHNHNVMSPTNGAHPDNEYSGVIPGGAVTMNENPTPEHLKQTFTLDFWTRPKPGGSKKGSVAGDNGSIDTNSEDNLCLQGDMESETTVEDGGGVNKQQRGFHKYTNSETVSRGMFDPNGSLFGGIDNMGGVQDSGNTGHNTLDQEVEQIEMQSSSSGGMASPEGVGGGAIGVVGVGATPQQFITCATMGGECCKQSIEHTIKITDLIEEIDKELEKIYALSKTVCVHVNELAVTSRSEKAPASSKNSLVKKLEQKTACTKGMGDEGKGAVSNNKGSQGDDRGTTPTSGTSSSGTPAGATTGIGTPGGGGHSPTSASIPAGTVPMDYVPFDFQLLLVADQIKELNTLAKKVHLSNILSSKIVEINQKWQEIRTEMDGYMIKEQDLDLGYSLVEPWKRKVTSNSVPYFLNTSTRVTQWDHPLLQMHMKNIHEKTQEVYLAAYRLALKCRATQKFLLLWKMKAEDILHTCIDYANADIINVSDMEKMLKKLYGNVVRAARRPLVADLAMNWVIKMYDPKRTGSIRLDSLITALILLSSSTPAEKFYYLFKLAADDNMELDYNRLSVLLYDIIQVPLSLLETTSSPDNQEVESVESQENSEIKHKILHSETFNMEAAVQSCLSFKPTLADKEVNLRRTAIDLTTWMTWIGLEPQCLVWVSLTHRVTLSEQVTHKFKCAICSNFPIRGFRYRCLKCFNFNICQNCFFMGLNYQFHKPYHPIQEYCTSQTSGENVRVLFTVLRNRFKSQKNRIAYLPTPTSFQNDSHSSICMSGYHCDSSHRERSESSTSDHAVSTSYRNNVGVSKSGSSTPPYPVKSYNHSMRAKSVGNLDFRSKNVRRDNRDFSMDQNSQFAHTENTDNHFSSRKVESPPEIFSPSHTPGGNFHSATLGRKVKPVPPQRGNHSQDATLVRGTPNGSEQPTTNHVSFYFFKGSADSINENGDQHFSQSPASRLAFNGRSLEKTKRI